MTTLLNHIGALTFSEERLSIAMGHHQGVTPFRKFGMNAAVASGTEEMWRLGTERVLPAAAGVVSIVSSSTADAAAGTGAAGVFIEGLDANYGIITESVVLTGTTPVNTSQSFLRINRMYTTTPGSTSTTRVNAGGITASIGGNAQAYIETGEGQTHQTHYTVPANHIILVTTYLVETGRMAGSADVAILAQLLPYGTDGTDTTWRTISDRYVYQHSAINDATVTILPPKADLRQKIVSNISTQAASVFGGYMVNLVTSGLKLDSRTGDD